MSGAITFSFPPDDMNSPFVDKTERRRQLILGLEDAEEICVQSEQVNKRMDYDGNYHNLTATPASIRAQRAAAAVREVLRREKEEK